MLSKRLLSTVFFARLLASSLALVVPSTDDSLRSLTSRDESAAGKLVFCHFMMGVVSGRTSAADYDDDMKRAKDAGIDAFALNIGTDSYTDTQLGFAYESAANNDMKVFMSFDFNWFPTDDATTVGNMIRDYAEKPAQLFVGDKVFASSFVGDGLDVAAMRSAAGRDVFWAPNFRPDQAGFADVDGALNWVGWDNNGDNRAPDSENTVTVEDGDSAYTSALGDKPYIAPVSPWFSTHFGAEVSYSKNWVFPSDQLWFHRWTDILTKPYQYLEIITWNDYGESHYVGRLDSMHSDDGNSKWTYGMPHNAWLSMAKPFISAFHDDASSVNKYVAEDRVFYWYRPTLKSINCDDTDTMGKPDGWETMADSVFVVTLLTDAATLTVNAGSNRQDIEAEAGASIHAVDMSPGQVSFALKRGDSTILQGTSDQDIVDVCPCGIYNFNAYTGALPPEEPDELQPDGYATLAGSTCGP